MVKTASGVYAVNWFQPTFVSVDYCTFFTY